MAVLFGPKRIGLALGSGAARGLAHIGVLKVLEAEELLPEVITGTSMGAIIGAFYAAGIPVADIERIALEFDVRSVSGVGDMALGKGAVFAGDKVQAFLRTHLPATFEELKIPFGCVATDLATSRPVRFTSGDLVSAIRASVSVPLAFVPVRMDGMLLVDGYVFDPLPVGFAKQLGGQTIVAVDVSGSGLVPLPDDVQVPAAARVLQLAATVRSGAPYRRTASGLDVVGAVSETFERQLAEQSAKRADVVISPAVHGYSGMEFGQVAALIGAGEDAARRAVPSIRTRARR